MRCTVVCSCKTCMQAAELFRIIVEINSVIYTFGFCLKTCLSSYPALSRMSIDTGNPLCS